MFVYALIVAAIIWYLALRVDDGRLGKEELAEIQRLRMEAPESHPHRL